MRLIDSHTHLYLDSFAEDLPDVVARAKTEGVAKALLPNIDSSTIADLKKTLRFDQDFFIPMMGLHPTSVKGNYQKELESIEAELRNEKYIAVGEIGIDLYWDQTYRNEQMDAFERQIVLAKQLDLPIVIHSRESFDEIFTVVDRQNDEKLRGVFHCFTGTLHRARHIIEYGGFKLGIGGVVTFKNSKLDEVLKEIPLEHIVLETDSPYLTPVPHRGRRNESSYIKFVAERIAAIYGIDIEEVAEKTTKNCEELFRL